jgi:hypothetical protein
MPFVILPTNSISGGYDITNSLRFNSASTDYLNRTNGTPTGTTKYTFSTWLKISKLSSRGQFFRVINPSSTATYAFLETDGSNFFGFTDYNGTSSLAFTTTAVFRDVSAWYHLVLAVDTTQATSTNRWKFYVNGVEVTSFASTSYGTQNQTIMATSSGKDANIGGDPVGAGATRKFDGYMSDVFFIDGQTLTPSSFGETDTDTGIWKPKAYTGSFGTNGFYLQFKNSASLGTDSSGNGNTFTVNNLTSIDQTTDTPTNNFATINTLTCNDTGTLTSADGNLTITGGNDMGATIGITKGKWYWESKRSNTGTAVHWGIGFTQSWNSSTQIVTGNGSGIFIRQDFVGGYSVINSGSNGFTSISGSTTGSSIANGDIVGVALDLDSATKSITFYQNGSSVGSGTFSYDGTTTFCTPFIRNNSGGQTQWNFGNPPFTISSGNADANGYGNFEYAPPSGYYALCTKNLATFG